MQRPRLAVRRPITLVAQIPRLHATTTWLAELALAVYHAGHSLTGRIQDLTVMRPRLLVQTDSHDVVHVGGSALSPSWPSERGETCHGRTGGEGQEEAQGRGASEAEAEAEAEAEMVEVSSA